MTFEARRIEALQACTILDTAPHPAFDALTRAAALALRVPIALISLVDEERQWFKSVMGLPLTETPRSISFCNHTIEGFEPMIVEDAARDLRFCHNPLVTGEPGVRFYAGAPLIDPEGFALGTLCVLDRVPRVLSVQEIRLLGHLADAVMHAITAHVHGLELRRLREKIADMKAFEDLSGPMRQAV